MILELSDLLAIAGMLAPLYIGWVMIVIRVVRFEQYCKDKTGYCPGGPDV